MRPKKGEQHPPAFTFHQGNIFPIHVSMNRSELMIEQNGAEIMIRKDELGKLLSQIRGAYPEAIRLIETNNIKGFDTSKFIQHKP